MSLRRDAPRGWISEPHPPPQPLQSHSHGIKPTVYNMGMKTHALLLVLLTIALPCSVTAVETAERISDREIIESLAEIKAQFKVIDQRFDAVDQRFDAVDQRFDAVDQRFDAVDQRFETMQRTIDERFETMQRTMDERFTALNDNFDRIWSLMLVVIAGIFGLIGFIIWDRYSTLRPLERRMHSLEDDLERDLELKAPEGSRLTRLIHALRDLAKEDSKVEAVLRSYWIL